jgi:raffinose/stachyose/melibiose transport system permease protein
MYGVFVLAPSLHTIWLSFFRWDGVGDRTWAGFSNYHDLFVSSELRSAFLHSLVLIVFFSILPVLLGLLLASTLSRANVPGSALFRTLLFLPQVITSVVIAVIWRWIYSYDGPLNALLRSLGLGDVTRAWLGDFGWALPSIGLVGTWVAFGLCMTLFIAGAQKIPTSLYDAARVDGAGPLREFFAVTLPGIRNEVVVALTLTVIAALRSFDLIFITTRGGPGRATTVPALEIYNRAFVFGEVGAAAAIATVLGLIIAAIAYAITRLGEGSQA